MPGLVFAASIPLLAAIATLFGMAAILLGIALGRDSAKERARRTHER